MNERIAHLYQVSIQDTMDYHDENPKLKQKELDNFCATRFSELIVQECIETLNKRFMGDLNREDMEVRRCIDDVKKHFGVENGKS